MRARGGSRHGVLKGASKLMNLQVADVSYEAKLAMCSETEHCIRVQRVEHAGSLLN